MMAELFKISLLLNLLQTYASIGEGHETKPTELN